MRSLRCTEAFKTFVLEQLSDLDDLAARAMFGGVGLYCDEFFFGLIAEDVLYVRADDANRAEYTSRGAKDAMGWACAMQEAKDLPQILRPVSPAGAAGLCSGGDSAGLH